MNNETFSFLLGSQTKEPLSHSISRLEEKFHGVDGKEKARLLGILEVAHSLRDSFPLMKTQKAGHMYKGEIRESEKMPNENEPKIARTSSIRNLHCTGETSKYNAFEDQGHWIHHGKQGRRTFPGVF